MNYELYALAGLLPGKEFSMRFEECVFGPQGRSGRFVEGGGG